MDDWLYWALYHENIHEDKKPKILTFTKIKPHTGIKRDLDE